MVLSYMLGHRLHFSTFFGFQMGHEKLHHLLWTCSTLHLALLNLMRRFPRAHFSSLPSPSGWHAKHCFSLNMRAQKKTLLLLPPASNFQQRTTFLLHWREGKGATQDAETAALVGPQQLSHCLCSM